MRERAKAADGRDAKEVLICTFHALGVRMLRQDGAALGLKPQFSILDSDDVTSILKDAAAPPTPPRRASGSGPSAPGRTRA
jgi:ATP-dependent DNA helicase Rep